MDFFNGVICYFGLPSRALVAYHLERSGMPLHGAVGINDKTGATTDIKAQLPRIWDKRRMFDDCARVI